MVDQHNIVFGACRRCGIDVPWRCSVCHIFLPRLDEEHVCPFGQHDGRVFAICAGCELLEEEEDEGYESGFESDENQPLVNFG